MNMSTSKGLSYAVFLHPGSPSATNLVLVLVVVVVIIFSKY